MVTFDTLKRLGVHATDSHLGHIKDLLFDDQDFVVRYLALDTSQWMPMSKKVLISPISLRTIDLDNHVINLNLSEQLVKECPSLDEHKPVCREYEEILFKYFGYGYYWVGPGAWGEYAHPSELAKSELEEITDLPEKTHRGQNHLRSCKEVIDYNVCADGESVGHIRDFYVDPESWSITHLVVELGNWLPGGQHIKVDVTHCEKIDWPSHSAYISLSKAALQELESQSA